MVFSVRVLTACAVAAVAGVITDAEAQSVDGLRASITDNSETSQVESGAPAPAVAMPRLTVAEETEAAEAPPRRPAARQIDPYAPAGLPFGGLRLYPALEVGGVASSNIRQSAARKQAGAGLEVAPSLRLESDWVRHSWQTDIRGNYTAYARNSDANVGAVNADSRFRLDIRRTTFAEFEAGYNLTPTRPDDSGLAGGTDGTRLDQTFSAAAALTHDFGGLSARVRTELERQLYGDEDLIGGGSRNNDDLNNWKPSASLRLTYTDAPVLQPFVEAGYARRIHDDDNAASGQSTDSGDIDLRLGASFDDGALWSGELALTYLRRDYKDSSLNRVQAFGINGNLTWRPTELTTVVAEAETSLDDASTDGRNYSLNLNLSHVVQDNILLRANSGVELDRSSDGNDLTVTAGAGIEYQFAPELAWTAGYDATLFRAANSKQDYTEHRLSMGIILRR